MKEWQKEGINLLEKSLKPFPQELNELDWKSSLSTKTERLSQHISAFSNYRGGGFMVFGVDNGGNIVGISETECENVITTLGNIARQNLIPPTVIDFDLTSVQSKNLLFVKICEATDRPFT